MTQPAAAPRGFGLTRRPNRCRQLENHAAGRAETRANRAAGRLGAGRVPSAASAGRALVPLQTSRARPSPSGPAKQSLFQPRHGVCDPGFAGRPDGFESELWPDSAILERWQHSPRPTKTTAPKRQWPSTVRAMARLLSGENAPRTNPAPRRCMTRAAERSDFVPQPGCRRPSRRQPRGPVAGGS